MRFPVACVLALVTSLAAAPAAHAAATCERAGTTVTVAGEPEFASVFVSGDEIRAFTTSAGTIDCGDATTANTDDVVLQAPPDVLPGATAGMVGPFPGGATDEPGDSDEIEVAIRDYPAAGVITDQVAHFAGGRRGDGALVANLDADKDDEVDLVTSGPVEELELIGGNGDDFLYGDGSAGTGAPDVDVNILGQGGDDTLTGGAMGGGAGDDTLIDPSPAAGDAIADYVSAAGPVKVELPGGTLPGEDGNGGTDTFVGVTEVQGSTFADELTAATDDAILYGAGGQDVLQGGGGADVLYGGASADLVHGGGGDDVMITHGLDGPDVYEGGPGSFDQVRYGDSAPPDVVVGRTAPVAVTIGTGADDGEAGEGDDVRGDVEVVFGGRGADTLTGDGSPEILFGLEGADTLDGAGGDDIVLGDGATLEALVDAGNVLTGGPGKDSLVGSEGPDDLRAADGEADSLACGGGVDFGPFDAGDSLAEDCEHRPAGAAPPEGPPAIPPLTPLTALPSPPAGEPSLVRRRAPRVARRRGGRLRVDTGLSAACPEGGPACSVRVSLKVLRVSARTRRRGKLFLTTKGPRFAIAPGDALRIARLLTPVGRRVLLRRGSLRIVIRATFRVGGGPVVVRQATIVVRRPG